MEPLLVPEFNFTLQWLERHPNQVLTGLLKCCDSFSSEYFAHLPSLGVAKDVAAEVLEAFDTHTVMRCNTVLLLTPASNLPLNLTIAVGLTKVGNTSWKTGFRICDRGEPVALISSVCVNVDSDTLSKSTPVPHKEHLEPLVCIVPGMDELDAVDAAWQEGEIPSSAWTWTTTVRATDCDKLGHVNNAVYLLLAEECRAMCAAGGFYTGSGGQEQAAAEALAAHVDYLNQTLPFEALDVVTWFEGSKRPGGNGKFCFVFRQRDVVTANVVLGVLAEF